MQIRALTPSDAQSFQSLRLRGLIECPEAFASSHEEEVAIPLEELARRLEPTPDSAVFGAFDAAELRALAGLQRETQLKLAHKAFLWGVYVAPEVRGRGVGSRIVAHALQHAASVLRARQVNLGVNTRNKAAIALYRKLGFVPFGLEAGFLLLDGVLHDEHLMVRRLANPA